MDEGQISPPAFIVCQNCKWWPRRGVSKNEKAQEERFGKQVENLNRRRSSQQWSGQKPKFMCVVNIQPKRQTVNKVQFFLQKCHKTCFYFSVSGRTVGGGWANANATNFTVSIQWANISLKVYFFFFFV